jgi:hypothetical protein
MVFSTCLKYVGKSILGHGSDELQKYECAKKEFPIDIHIGRCGQCNTRFIDNISFCRIFHLDYGGRRDIACGEMECDDEEMECDDEEMECDAGGGGGDCASNEVIDSGYVSNAGGQLGLLLNKIRNTDQNLNLTEQSILDKIEAVLNRKKEDDEAAALRSTA